MVAVLLAVALGADPASRALARLLDSPDAAVRRAASDALAAEEDLALLDRVAAAVRTGHGRAPVAELFAKRRAELRRRVVDGGAGAARAVAPALRGLSEEALWALGVAPAEDGVVLFFDARAFDADPKWDRRRVLEYLVCVDPPPEGVASKAYETLAGMAPAELAAFRAFAAGRPRLVLRWRSADRGLVAVPLLEALPGARLRFSDLGLSLGGNRDERANANLPPDGVPIQLGA